MIKKIKIKILNYKKIKISNLNLKNKKYHKKMKK